ncbi:prephenate dehydratase [Evansella tamaricis]|uniref:Prephenate dehydratase n=1 Tax=Evansella tamaricis TaxID=2069301 RepID=A0ABS6JJX0_9BACI|nr:prephenate dehydratase [Evansella tamaricis]MBU9713984.1 prephenate dehydratase [Evansella tamaricis]
MGTVGFLGPKGSFTEAAAKALLPNEQGISFRTIPDCIDAVKDNIVDCAVVPLENAIEGSVNITLDYLIHHQRMTIAAEITAPIYQHLMIKEENKDKWQEVTAVYSHPHAIAQCHKFIREHLNSANLSYTSSTAEAARFVSEAEENIAAIANTVAAKEYGLTIVQSEINDYNNNSTRFIVLKNGNLAKDSFQKDMNEQQYKTTMMITLPSDYTGALHQVLSAFSWRKINLSKIESRPMKTGIGNYFFIIDVDMLQDNVLIPGVCEELKALGCGVEILGSYPCYTWNVKKVQNNGIN